MHRAVKRDSRWVCVLPIIGPIPCTPISNPSCPSRLGCWICGLCAVHLDDWQHLHSASCCGSFVTGLSPHFYQRFVGWSPEIHEALDCTSVNDVEQRDLYDRPPSVRREKAIAGQSGENIHIHMHIFRQNRDVARRFLFVTRLFAGVLLLVLAGSAPARTVFGPPGFLVVPICLYC